MTGEGRVGAVGAGGGGSARVGEVGGRRMAEVGGAEGAVGRVEEWLEEGVVTVVEAQGRAWWRRIMKKPRGHITTTRPAAGAHAEEQREEGEAEEEEGQQPQQQGPD